MIMAAGPGIPLRGIEEIGAGIRELRKKGEKPTSRYTHSQLAVYAAARSFTCRQRKGARPGLARLSIEQASREVGIAASSIGTARWVWDFAPDEMLHQVLKGEISVHAVRFIMEKVPVGQQTQAMRRVIEKNRTTETGKCTILAKATGVRPPITPNLAPPTGRAKTVQQLRARMERGLDQLEGVVELLSSYCQESHSPEDTEAWVRRLRRARVGLSRIIRQEEGSNVHGSPQGGDAEGPLREVEDRVDRDAGPAAASADPAEVQGTLREEHPGRVQSG